MTQPHLCSHEDGSVAVETALVTPIILLVTFASVFFLIIAVRNFCVQMVANDIAKNISLSLQINSPIKNANCMINCGKGTGFAGVPFRNVATYTTTNLQCFRDCANTKYLLNGSQLSITLATQPVFQWYDTVPTPSATPTTNNSVAAGDLIQVTVTYPISQVLGANVPLLGSLSGNLTGTAVAVMERPNL